MKIMIRLAAILLASIAIAGSAHSASETDSLNQIRKSLGGLLTAEEVADIEKVSAIPNSKLYEVITSRSIYYTDESVSFLFRNGALYDVKTKTNLTAKTTERLSEFDFNKLPLKDAIKVVRGDGSRKVVTIEDVNCGYCQQLQREFTQIDNVTIYTFMVSILAPDSLTKANRIWCSQDKAATWRMAMLDPSTAKNLPDAVCETPLDRNNRLFAKLRLQGIPAILFDDNTKVGGVMRANALEGRLKTVKEKK